MGIVRATPIGGILPYTWVSTTPCKSVTLFVSFVRLDILHANLNLLIFLIVFFLMELVYRYYCPYFLLYGTDASCHSFGHVRRSCHQTMNACWLCVTHCWCPSLNMYQWMGLHARQLSCSCSTRWILCLTCESAASVGLWLTLEMVIGF